MEQGAQGTQLGRIIIPTEVIARPGGPNRHEPKTKLEICEAEWHGIGILYSRNMNNVIELRLFYESHISQHAKDEIANRFGVGAIEWNVEAE